MVQTVSYSHQFTKNDIEILHEEIVYKGFFTLKKIQFRHKLFAGGMSDVVVRELLVKGAASAVIAYDPEADNVVMVEQVRIGAFDPAYSRSPWQLELIAGMIESGETPENVALRESEEEAGISITNLEHAVSFWDSPGGQLERVHVFAGKADSAKAKGLHGLAEEHEDIRVQVLARETAYTMMCNGEIDNGIAVVGLQWLQLNYRMLQQKWR